MNGKLFRIAGAIVKDSAGSLGAPRSVAIR